MKNVYVCFKNRLEFKLFCFFPQQDSIPHCVNPAALIPYHDDKSFNLFLLLYRVPNRLTA